MIFDVLVLVVALVAIAVTAWRADKRVNEAVARMERETQARAAAIDKQAKVFVRKLEASRRAGEKALDSARDLRADTQQLHGVVNQFMSSPGVRRILDREVSGGQ